MSDIALAIGANTRGLEAGLDRARSRVRQFSAAINRSLLAVGAGAISASAATSALDRIAERLDRINDLSQQTGVSTDFLQDLAFNAGQSGTDLDLAAKAIKDLVGEINSAAAPSKQLSEALAGVGLRAGSLRGLTPDALFLQVARAIGSQRDETVQLTAVTDILGMKFTELVPLMQSVARNGFAEVSKASRDTVEGIAAARDEMEKARLEWEASAAPAAGIWQKTMLGGIRVLSSIPVLHRMIFEQFGSSAFEVNAEDQLRTLKGNWRRLQRVWGYGPAPEMNSAMDAPGPSQDDLDRQSAGRWTKARAALDEQLRKLGEQVPLIKQLQILESERAQLERAFAATAYENEGRRLEISEKILENEKEQLKARRELDGLGAQLRVNSLKRDEDRWTDRAEGARRALADPALIRTSHLRSVGGGGVAVGPDTRRLEDLQKQANAELVRIRAALDEAGRGGGGTTL